MIETFEPVPSLMADGMVKEAQIAMFLEVADTNEEGMISKDELTNFFDSILDKMEQPTETEDLENSMDTAVLV